MILNKFYQISAKNNICLYLLIFQIGIFLLLNILWEYNSYIMPIEESSVHMLFTCLLPGINNNNLIFSPYPMLIHYLTKPLLNIFTDEKWAYFSVSAIFVCINVIATYFCTTMLGSKKIALFAASALLWLPLTMIACRTYTLDYPLAAIITLWFLCFLKSNRFKKTIPSVLFAILIFVSSLIKYTYFSFIFPCFIGMVYHLYTNGRSDTIKKKHLALAAFFLIFAAVVYFNGSWIACIKATGIILAIEGRFLYRKDHGIGQLFFLTGIGLILSIYFFSFAVEQYALEKLELYKQNTLFGINFAYHNIYLTALSLSLLLRAILIIIKAKFLTPVVFWFFMAGAMLIIGRPRLRHKYSLLLFPLIVSPIYMLCTSSVERYQYPLLSFYCMISAVWLNGKRLTSIKNYLFVFGMLIITLSGIYLSGGWLSSTALSLPAHNLSREFGNSEYNANINAYYRQKSQSSHYIIEFSNTNYLAELLSLNSQFSNSLLYTFSTYDIDWNKCLEPITQLPDNSLLNIKVMLKLNLDEEYIQSELLGNIINFYANRKNKQINISETGDYILTMQSIEDTPLFVKKLHEKYLNELSKETDIVKQWHSGKYLFKLFKRKTLS